MGKVTKEINMKRSVLEEEDFDDNGTAMMADLAMMMTTMMVPILWYHR